MTGADLVNCRLGLELGVPFYDDHECYDTFLVTIMFCVVWLSWLVERAVKWVDYNGGKTGLEFGL